MKKQILKSVLCLSLSAALVFGEASAVLAEPASVSETETQATDVEAKTETAIEETTETQADESVDTNPLQETDTQPEADQTVVPEAQDADSASAEDVDAVGEKIVPPYTLADVTGLAYDAVNKLVVWNKVPGATRYFYEITYTNAAGVEVKEESGNTANVYLNLDDMDLTTDQAYTIKVAAVNWNELYLVAADVAGIYTDQWDPASQKWIDGIYSYDAATGAYTLLYMEGRDFDELSSKQVTDANGQTSRVYTLYKYPASVNWALIAAAPKTSAEQNVKYTAVTALGGVALKEINRGTGSAVFAVTPSKVQDWETIQFEYSNNAEFKSDSAKKWFKYSGNADANGEYSVSLSDFTAGDVIYVRARTYNPSFSQGNGYSAYVTTNYAVPKAVLANVNVTVDASSIRLDPVSGDGKVTGYEYQRKNGKKWIGLAKQGSAYTDAGLKADTKYTYRVRGYAYNQNTGKTTYTDWKKVSAYTWGAALKLKASAASSTAIKLTWSKIAKAEGYEIYRYDTTSNGYDYTKGEYDDVFSNATLIKTIKKSKTVKYTDKKLEKGNEYHYLVRAYRTVGKQKYYINGAASLRLDGYGTINGLNSYYKSTGQLVVTWNKATGISGYKVEKKNPATGQWTAYKSLKKSATSVTLPKVTVGMESEIYRIKSVNKTAVYDMTGDITVEPVLAAVKNVKAVQTAEGVKVTWSKVAGADYYQVFRTTKEADSYDKTTKTYQDIVGNLVVEAVFDVSSSTNLVPKSVAQNSHIINGQTVTTTDYTYDPNLKVAYNGELYNDLTSYSTNQITGTSVIDKPVTVQKLVRKDSDPNYTKATDPEYYTNGSGFYTYSDRAEYKKNADGSLMTETAVKARGPEAGNQYYYYVVAYAKPANGSNENNETTSSIGCTKGAKVVYTKKTAKAAKVSSVKSSKKATATISIKTAKGAKGYAIYRSAKKNGTYVQVGTTTKKTFTDNNVVGGKTYYYKVASYVTSENGTYVYSKLSAAKSVKVKK